MGLIIARFMGQCSVLLGEHHSLGSIVRANPPRSLAPHSPFSPRVKKKNKPLNLKIHNSVGSCENIPSQRSPLLSERSLRSFFVGYPPFLPSTPPVHTDATFSASKSRRGTAGRHAGVPCKTCKLEDVTLGRCKSTGKGWGDVQMDLWYCNECRRLAAWRWEIHELSPCWMARW